MVGLAWLALIALVDGRLARLWSLIARRAPAAELVSEGGKAQTPGEAVRAEVARLGGGAYLGVEGAGSWVLADPESAVMVLGPPRSGKTSAVMIPAVMGASGAVIATSTKPEVMRATVAARSEVGQAWLFDPAASERRLPDGVRRLCWSPVAAASSWDEALVMARAMADCTRVGAGTTNESHWTERAAALLAPLLYAANLSDRPIAEVLRWTLRQDLLRRERCCSPTAIRRSPPTCWPGSSRPTPASAPRSSPRRQACSPPTTPTRSGRAPPIPTSTPPASRRRPTRSTSPHPSTARHFARR